MSPIWRGYLCWIAGTTCGVVFTMFRETHFGFVVVVAAITYFICLVISSLEEY